VAAPPPAADPARTLGPLRKSVYAGGDFTLNASLAALSMIYTTYFLTQVADLRPALAGLVLLIGRFVDAFADPLMGRLSDLTPWRAGRRRPYFLIGAIPYGVTFALLWITPPFSDSARFAYYSAIYLLHALAMTVLTVPYMAILPEMALDYDARTSLNTFRSFGATLGIVAAVVGIRPLAHAFGGGPAGFAAAGAVFGVVLALPWLAVHRVTFERRGFRVRPAALGFRDGLRVVARHRAFRQLTFIYIMGRIAMDLAGALLILYMTFWIGRSSQFEPLMAIFLASVIAALPIWLRIARTRDKLHVFVMGSIGWAVTSVGMVLVQPDWPAWILFAWVPFVGLGYAVVDLMPWSMLGEVIDEDDLATGERREGLYNGVFTFLRKLGGALGVFLAMSLLEVLGFRQGSAQQTEAARQAIRWMTALGPPVLLFVGVWLTRGYPLTRQRHREILDALLRRDSAARIPGAGGVASASAGGTGSA
jgi:sugar (glycoside-pentoside-hexuronide) transporter